jgi:hypothetical protein
MAKDTPQPEETLGKEEVSQDEAIQPNPNERSIMTDTVVAAATPWSPGYSVVGNTKEYNGMTPGDAALVLANQDSINAQGITGTINAVGRDAIASAERFGLHSASVAERFGLAHLEAIRDTKESVTSNTKDIIIDSCNKHTVNLLQHAQTQREVEEKTCAIKALIIEQAAKTQDMIRDDREQRLRDELASARQELLLIRLGGGPLPV